MLMFQVGQTPGGESVVSVLVNAVEGGEDVLKHRSVNPHLKEETWKKNVSGLKRDTCPYHSRSAKLQVLGDS